MTTRTSRLAWVTAVALAASGVSHATDRNPITIRTESYPRPPYSGATYYIYEQDGKVICTKLSVCDKYDHCDTSYHAGAFKAQEDVRTDRPYDSSPAVVVSEAKLRKHQCLVKFVPGAF